MTEENLKSLELVELVYEMVEDAKSVPMTGKAMIDKKEVLNILEQIMQLYPDEYKKAQWVLRKKDDMLTDANERLHTAKVQSAEFIESQIKNHDIIREAKERASTIISNAEVESRQIRIYAREYADDILKELQKEIDSTTNRLLAHMKNDMEDFAKSLTQHMTSTNEVIKENSKELKTPLNSNN